MFIFNFCLLFLYTFSSDDELEDEASPRRSSLKTTPSPRKDKRISFAGDDETEFRVVTPEILKVLQCSLNLE